MGHKGPNTQTQHAETLISAPDQRLRVFISSTPDELEAEREAARDAIRTMRLTPVMFDKGAPSHPPADVYRTYLEQSEPLLEQAQMSAQLNLEGAYEEKLAEERGPAYRSVDRDHPGEVPHSRRRDLADGLSRPNLNLPGSTAAVLIFAVG